MTRFVTVELTAVVELTEAEVWPDDVPEDWTIDDVRQAMENSGPMLSVLRDWDLLRDLEVTISDDDGDSTEVWAS